MSEEPDAVADYLARERAALGDDADVFAAGGVPDVSNGTDDFDMGAFSSAPTPAPAAPQEHTSKGIDSFPDLMDDGNNGQEVRVTGVDSAIDPERAQFESQFPDIQPAVEPSSVPYGASPYPAQPYSGGGPSTSNYQSILPPPAFSTAALPEEDSEPIKAWKVKQQEQIKARDEESKKKREEVIVKAEKAIDSFYERYNGDKAKNIKLNKESEAAFIAELSESVSKGTSWQRITDVIELQNSQSKTIRPSAPGGSDLARMKEMLLALRREGEKAPAAAGY